ncbi:GAF domain-containing sensor histidine kinase [Patulibacter brassicae]|uniref:histidine kinase n=1 Tax=Patulibacter brassicae TaxID=1705717 RepID=A0ABU4VN09_9ACTN|nr:GAF domain-containing sensor histidine kinase [Patulibacter brassicae]MDX8152165.1 GAF domain-containing sensor histidine kinase [Patulibacter brassicae]
MQPEQERNDVIARAMEAARDLTGLEIAYVSRFHDGVQEIERTTTAPTAVGITEGMVVPLEDTYCQRIVDGRMPSVILDTAANPVTAELDATAGANIGSYLSVPIRLHDGRLYGTLCCASSKAIDPLSERELELVRILAQLVAHQLDEHEQQAAALRAQQEFLASVSHDLRSPLNAIGLLADELRDRVPDVDPAEAGRMIREEARRVLAQVDDVLLVTTQRAGALRLRIAPTDLRALAAEVVETASWAAQGAGVALRLEAPAPLVAEVDATRLRRALQNLVDNAVKYSPDGGTTRVRVDRDASTALVVVADEGIGIDPEEVARLGERFFRASSAHEAGIGGTGLGLATVQAVAEAHEGLLEVASTRGAGSRFALRVPLRHRAV